MTHQTGCSFVEVSDHDFTHSVFHCFKIFRDEGKIARKLIECINIFLLKDGPNLGCQCLEIHNAVQQFVLRSWLTSHDRGLKVS